MQNEPNAIMQAANLFVFGINNPVRWVDPSGLFIISAMVNPTHNFGLGPVLGIGPIINPGPLGIITPPGTLGNLGKPGLGGNLGVGTTTVGTSTVGATSSTTTTDDFTFRPRFEPEILRAMMLRAVLARLLVTREEWGAQYPRNHPGWSAPNAHRLYWGPGSLEDPIGIVFHHTASNNFNMYDNHVFGRSTPYHFIIAQDGRIFEGRPLGHLGDHVGGHNTGRIGIGFTGNFEMEGSMPTSQALFSAEILVSYLTLRYTDIREFRAHSDFENHRNNGDFARNQAMLNWIGRFGR